MTLYEMTEHAQTLRDMLDAEEIDEQTFNDTLEAIGADDKVNSYCQIIRELDGDNAAIKAEIERLKKRIEHNTSSINRMKQALDGFMTASGKKKEKTAFFSVSYRKSQSVDILNEADIPQEYIKVKTETAPDKVAIKAALKAGEAIPGCQLKDTESIQIR